MRLDGTLARLTRDREKLAAKLEVCDAEAAAIRRRLGALDDAIEALGDLVAEETSSTGSAGAPAGRKRLTKEERARIVPALKKLGAQFPVAPVGEIVSKIAESLGVSENAVALAVKKSAGTTPGQVIAEARVG